MLLKNNHDIDSECHIETRMSKVKNVLVLYQLLILLKITNKISHKQNKYVCLTFKGHYSFHDN
jgi:hypothetical protein